MVGTTPEKIVRDLVTSAQWDVETKLFVIEKCEVCFKFNTLHIFDSFITSNISKVESC